jgi:N-acetyl sugar amidotransferase
MGDFKQCAVSVMDNIADPNITFDEKGISNYFYSFQNAINQIPKTEDDRKKAFEQQIKEIKRAGQGKKYDCVLGLSGGVDSSYMAKIAFEQGLRPLVVHFDNGWNSEQAVGNIQKIIDKCSFDLHTLVVDWDEFKDMQKAYLKAGVIDIEVLSDHAIIATMKKLALKYKIKYILSGYNIQTEQVLPKAWVFEKADHINIQDICSRFGTLKKYPSYPFFDRALKLRANFGDPTKSIKLLELVDYKKEEAKSELKSFFDWQDYGGKHYESVWTRFYQGYILPRKFKVDKRKAHLSNLIFMGQLTKDQALAELEHPIYPPELFKKDYDLVLKKLGFSASEFESIMDEPAVSHTQYKTEIPWSEKFPLAKKFADKILK